LSIDRVVTDPADYTRSIEAYLCRKNDGHLIRIIGPAFEQVCGWAQRGVPLNVAYRGIDRYVERYYAKGPKRRPVRIEFCEADVLDVFDEWRRAVGVTAWGAGPSSLDGTDNDAAGGSAHADRRTTSLPAHLERVIARLTTLRGTRDTGFDEALDTVVREIDTARAGARGLRGAAREALLDRLRELDRTLVACVRAGTDAEALQDLSLEAALELEPFKSRMPPEAYEQSCSACVDRLLRQRARLPVLAFD
jgi:hypothetical protein